MGPLFRSLHNKDHGYIGSILGPLFLEPPMLVVGESQRCLGFWVSV